MGYQTNDQAIFFCPIMNNVETILSYRPKRFHWWTFSIFKCTNATNVITTAYIETRVFLGVMLPHKCRLCRETKATQVCKHWHWEARLRLQEKGRQWIRRNAGMKKMPTIFFRQIIFFLLCLRLLEDFSITATRCQKDRFCFCLPLVFAFRLLFSLFERIVIEVSLNESTKGWYPFLRLTTLLHYLLYCCLQLAVLLSSLQV